MENPAGSLCIAWILGMVEKDDGTRTGWKRWWEFIKAETNIMQKHYKSS